ncbi:hypothetical protein K227x_28520 [Rubripirellula lacrimiformis]|uniref:Uncharacterized protein n=1 Tax=Rubripirellula lacrimiformis TaxID=1930273 RepID=A0A517NBF0_9BACT|nr:hypothetical protein K227x_28520 [Rubripirellula lacrimiformis]
MPERLNDPTADRPARAQIATHPNRLTACPTGRASNRINALGDARTAKRPHRGSASASANRDAPQSFNRVPNGPRV